MFRQNARRVARSLLASTSGSSNTTSSNNGGAGKCFLSDFFVASTPRKAQPRMMRCWYSSKSSRKRPHSETEILSMIRTRVAITSPSDIPDGSAGIDKIPEGVLYGNYNDPTEKRHLETQTEDERAILEELNALVFDREAPRPEDRFPPLEHFYQDLRSLEKEKRQEREKMKQIEQTMSRVKKIDRGGGSVGTGKRKTAVAQVRIVPARGPKKDENNIDDDDDDDDEEVFGEIIVNGKPMDEYFKDISLRQHVLAPLAATNTLGLFDVRVIVHGGGLSGQSQAARLGVARCLQNYDPAFRAQLKPMGLLTRDSRIVERKKPGLKKARKAFQWVKR